MSQLIIGTAGHIDHGKTALVNALTGVDTDSLKEEKERGLTIDLGFAHLGELATIIDVPGHEKFIRNMVAGVSTIDLVLFVVAADDGVMPQTREHLDILNLLRVRHGIIVITKIDLVDEEWLALVTEDVRDLVRDSFLENAPIDAVSTISNAGIPELKARVEEMAQEMKQREEDGLFWMPVDRAFTMKGFGTVVTGTVLAGALKVGESVELLPPQRLIRVRGLQSHGRTVECVSAGDRAAINLQSIEKDQVGRGQVVAAPNYFSSSKRFDARLNLLKSASRPLRTRSRVRVHFGTMEVMARVSIIKESQVEPGEHAFAQLHLERPAVARRLDPFVIRQYSPTITIGGGVILNANAPRRRLSDPETLNELQALDKEDPAEALENVLLASGSRLFTLEQLISEIAAAPEFVKETVAAWQENGKAVVLKKGGKAAVIHRLNFEKVQAAFLDVIAAFHNAHPTRPGVSKVELRMPAKSKIAPELLDLIIPALKQQGLIKERSGLLSLAEYKIELSQKLLTLKAQIAELLERERFTTSSPAEMAMRFSVKPETLAEVLGVMMASHEVVRAEGDIYFHPQAVAEVREKLVAFLQQHGEISISQFKDLLGGASRKYAMPLINHFDSLRVTQREGDVRVLASG
ncbi:MAG: selenocysteine-specific translation elongation factor [Calditrichaeota bacterium]|nr:selenocysteine-specific translation elongation factor [Calditrichota bacterium]